MPIDKPDLGDAISAAYGDDDEATAPAESTSDDTETPDSDDGAQAHLESESEEDSESEDQSEASDEVTDDLPDRYFEVERGDLSAEQWSAVIDSLKARDDTIGKLLRGKPEGGGEADQGDEAQADAPEPITDDAILQAFGLDPENPFDETAAKVVLPLVRSLEQLNAQVSTLAEERELEQLDRYWTSELDQLEAKNGELPIERLALLEFAAENGYQRPSDAYWAVAGPAKRQVEEAVAAAQKKVASATGKKKLAKEDVASKRTKGSNADATTVTTGKGVGKAVESSVSELLKDLGIG